MWVLAVATHAHTAELGLAGQGMTWDLGRLLPGETVTMRHASNLTVVTDVPWDLHVDSEVRAVPVDGDSGGQQVTPTATEILIALETDPEGGGGADWHSASAAGDMVVHGGPTGSEGKSVALSFQIRPSWSDSPTTTFQAEVTATLAAGEAMLSSYVQPNPILAGQEAPVAVWFFVPSDPDPPPNRTVSLVITKGDSEEVARVSGHINAPGWQRLVWEDLPAGGAQAGSYRYRVTDDGNRLYAGGIFQVQSDVGEGSQVALASVNTLFDASQSGGDSMHPAEMPLLPAINVAVTGKTATVGEPGSWQVAVINPELLSVFETKVVLCPPDGWRWLGADVPWVPGGSERSACRSYLLGTIHGHSEKEFTISLVQWPPYLRPATGLRSTLAVAVYGTPLQDRSPVLLTETKAVLKVGNDTVLSPDSQVRGVVFFDANGSGWWEEGEPLLSGAEVIADGELVGRSRRNGEYQVTLEREPAILWARSERGRGMPRFIPEVLPPPYDIDLPVAAAVVANRPAKLPLDSSIPSGAVRPATPAPAPDASDAARSVATTMSGSSQPQEHTAYEALILTRTAIGEWGGDGDGRLRWHSAGPWGSIDAGVDSAMAWNLATQANFTADAAYQAQGVVLSEGMRWEGAWREGFPEKIRWGRLRPTKPASSAWRLRVGASERLPRVKGAAAVERFTPVFSGELEAGEAEGDIWSCRLVRGQGAWTSGPAGVESDFTHVVHERTSDDGIEESTAGEIGVAAYGGMPITAFVWPYRIELRRSRPRTLSPSCGLSSREGWKWQAQTTVPGEGPLDTLAISGAAWPGAPSAHEMAASSKHVPLAGRQGVTIAVTSALQMGRKADSSEGSWVRPALRIEGDIGSRHRIHLETGPESMSRMRSPEDLELGARRFAAQWRTRRGSVRPWASYEVSGPDEERKSEVEAGLALSTGDLLPQMLGADVKAGVRASRRVKQKSLRDRVILDLARGRTSGRLEWTGKLPAQGRLLTPVGGRYGAAAWSVSLEQRRGPRRRPNRDVRGAAPGGPAALPVALAHTPDADGARDTSTRWGLDAWRLALDSSRTDTKDVHAGVARIEGYWPLGRWSAGVRRTVGSADEGFEQFDSLGLGMTYQQGLWSMRAEISQKVGIQGDVFELGSAYVAGRRSLSDRLDMVAEGEWSSGPLETRSLLNRLGVEWRLESAHVTGAALGVAIEFSPPTGVHSGQDPRLVVALTAPASW